MFQYKEFEQVVVEDRIEKEKQRRKQEQEAIELRACVKVQIVISFPLCPGRNKSVCNMQEHCSGKTTNY